MIYLHIGTEKTGTTSIQHFLWQRRKQLSRMGFYVPESLGANHRELTLYAALPKFSYDLRTYYDLNEERYQQFLLTFSERLHHELKPHLDQGSHILLTNEHLSSRLRHPDQIAKLHQLLQPLNTPIRVVVYVRQQEEIIPSSYSTQVKGGDDRDFETYINSIFLNLDYYDLLQKWSGVFGKENIEVVPYQVQQLVEGNAVTHFLHLIGVKLSVPSTAEVMNKALDVPTLEFLRHFNRYCPVMLKEQFNPLREGIIPLLTELATGTQLVMPQASAELFKEKYAQSNAKVAREYLNRADGCLFWEPEGIAADTLPVSSTLALSVDKAVEITAHLWTRLKQELLEQEQVQRQLQAQLKHLNAKKLNLKQQQQHKPIQQSSECLSRALHCRLRATIKKIPGMVWLYRRWYSNARI